MISKYSERNNFHIETFLLIDKNNSFFQNVYFNFSIAMNEAAAFDAISVQYIMLNIILGVQDKSSAQDTILLFG